MGGRIESNDKSYRHAAFDSGAVLEGKKLKLEGPDARQVQKAQKDAVLFGGLKQLEKEGLVKVGEEGVNKLADFAMKKGATRFGTALGALSLAAPAIATAATLNELLEKADEEAAEQNQAYNRDAVTLAAVQVGRHALPAGFIGHMEKELSVSKQGADKISTYLTVKHGPEGWKSIKASTERLIHQGQAQAKKLDIHDEKSLKAKLANKKSNFAAAYHASLALRIGVQSAIWSAQHPKH